MGAPARLGYLLVVHGMKWNTVNEVGAGGAFGQRYVARPRICLGSLEGLVLAAHPGYDYATKPSPQCQKLGLQTSLEAIPEFLFLEGRLPQLNYAYWVWARPLAEGESSCSDNTRYRITHAYAVSVLSYCFHHSGGEIW